MTRLKERIELLEKHTDVLGVRPIRDRFHDTNNHIQKVIAEHTALENKVRIIDERVDNLKIDNHEIKEALKSNTEAMKTLDKGVHDFKDTVNTTLTQFTTAFKTLIFIAKTTGWLISAGVLTSIFKALIGA